MKFLAKLLLTAAVMVPASTANAQRAWTPTPGAPSRDEQRTEEKSQLRESWDKKGQSYFADLARYGVSFDPSNDTPDTIGAFDVALSGSACIARTVQPTVVKALDSKPMSRQEEARIARAFGKGKGCTSIPTPILSLQRGLLSSGGYLVNHEAAPNFPDHIDEGLIQRFRISEREWNKDRVVSDRILMDASNCLVLSNLSLADELMRVRHGSEEEEQIMDALFAKAPDCAGGLRPTNVSKSFLRSFLSDALYRASVHEATAPLFGMRER